MLLAVLITTGCEKKVEPVDQYKVTVEFNNTGAKYDATGNVELNPKDSIYLNFNMVSPAQDISVVEIQKNGTRIDTFNVKGNPREFSGSKKYLVDSIAGSYTYRVLARDNKGVFIGDGGKAITVTIKPDFDYWSYRFLYVPDTTAKTNQTFFSTTTGQTFSYSNIGSNTGLIDFGYLYDTTTANKHTIYALNISPLPNQVSFYDFTSWTKNATIFKKVTTPAFTALTSGGALRSAGITNLASGTATKITALASGNQIAFRTAAGKYGSMQINFIDGASPAATTYINIDVKVQR